MSAVITEQLQQVLRNVASNIRVLGHYKGRPGEDRSGCCLVANPAYGYTALGESALAIRRQAMKELRRRTGEHDLPQWNDTHPTEEVLRMLEDPDYQEST